MRPPPTGTLDLSPAKVNLGQMVFNDPRFSASGAMSCATCHIKANAHADAPGGFLPLGGPTLLSQGLRSSPTLHYLDTNPSFRIENGQASGGFTWDGRADDRVAQAEGPFFAAAEMAAKDVAEVATKMRQAPYFANLMTTFGKATTASDDEVFETMKVAIATYEAGDADYHPFTSRFDAVLDGKATLTTQEARGLALFNNPNKGNCAACHSSTGDAKNRPVFTNFSYAALGVPRNTSTAARSDPNFFDLGLCGPNRTDLAHRAELCGQFKTPTLRNVALTAPYFHNAAINTLDEAVAFHITRDTDPGRWFPTANGQVQKFNDLPPAYQRNVTRVAPFNRSLGQMPALSDAEIADVVAFLKTLTDAPPAP